jgi:anti-anti-sigma factor
VSITLEKSEKQSTIRLKGAMDIAASAKLKTLLTQALSAARPVRVLLAGVSEMDCTGYQLLWAAGRDAGEAGVSFVLEGELPAALAAQLAAAGLPKLAMGSETGAIN